MVSGEHGTSSEQDHLPGVDPETRDAAEGASDEESAATPETGADSESADAAESESGSVDSATDGQPSSPPADEPPAKPRRKARQRAGSIPDGVLTVEDHLEKILVGTGPLEAYDQPLVESLGLPLHGDFVSPIDLPRFDQSTVDGYAIRASDAVDATRDIPVVLPVAGEVRAGGARPFAISVGTAARVTAGAPVPRGADCVVPLHHTDRGSSRVGVRVPPQPGQGVRRTGSEVAAGSTVLPAGSVLGAREIGLLASLGSSRVQARPRPRVVIFSMGSELREPGAHLAHDSTYDGNSYMLAAAVRSAGAIAYRVGAVGDDPKAFRRVLSDQLVRADLVVTTGGISDGARDVVRQTLRALGTVKFNDVAIYPGRTQGFGRVFDERTPIITLPGNPVSAYVGLEVFVLPALRRMMGRTPFRRPMVHAVLAADVASPSGRRQYVPGIFEVTHRGAKVTPLPDPDALELSELARANAFIVVGEDETALNLGDTVRTLVLDRPY